MRETDAVLYPVNYYVIRRAMAIVSIGCAIQVCAQEPPTIRVPVRLVSVPTLVVSKDGKYMPGLSAADFRVTDNGHPQAVKLDIDDLPISLVIAVQSNKHVADYLGFIQGTSALLEDSLAGANGDCALIVYGESVNVRKPLGEGDLQLALKALSGSSDRAVMADAGMRGIDLLKKQPGPGSRVLLFIGQPVDAGSKSSIADLEASAEREDVQIYSLSLPILNKSFVSDAFALQGYGSQWYKGGYEARVDLTKAVPALRRAGAADRHLDPFSVLTVATGGIDFHFRHQKQLENAIIAMGDALRSRYFLSYSPIPYDAGYHKIVVDVDVPHAAIYSRPGYQVTEE